MTVVPQSGGGVAGGNGSGTWCDVLELVVDRGLVIDMFVRVSLVGMEIAKVNARVVVAGVDTCLGFSEACNRLDLTGAGDRMAESPGERREAPERAMTGRDGAGLGRATASRMRSERVWGFMSTRLPPAGTPCAWTG
ncbi:gas vesicle protein GvpJ [Streptomyces sp. NPDC008238]